MLRAITDRIAKAQEYLHEIKDVCDRIGAHTNDPPPWMIALPIAYRRFGLRNEETMSIDPRIYDMAGMYLCRRFPELADYFASKGAIERVRSLQEEVLNVIEEAKRRDTHAENGQDSHEQENTREYNTHECVHDASAMQAAQLPRHAYNTNTVTRASITTERTTDNITEKILEEEKGLRQDLARVRELLQRPTKH